MVTAGATVLIIDDDKAFADELGEVLSLSGYRMVAVNDPDKALATLAAARPDVILLDLKMPGKNGFQLASEIKYLPDFSQVPIIAMSAYLRDDYAALMHICGIRLFLKKPFSPLDVIARIEEARALPDTTNTR